MQALSSRNYRSPIALPQPKAILFDWDNTLVDTWQLIHNAMNHVLARMGCEAWTFDEVKTRCIRSSRETFQTLFEDRASEAHQVFYDYVDEHHLKELEISPHVLGVLNFFKEKHVPLVLVSNKDKVVLQKEVQHLKIDHYFHEIIGSGVVEHDKPAPDMIFYALEKLNLPASENIWYVGDATTDYHAAKAAKITPLMVAHIETQEDYFYVSSLLHLQELYNC